MDETTSGKAGATPAYWFEKEEVARVMTTLQDLLVVQTPDDFKAWANGPLQNVLPHGMMVAGIAAIQAPNVQIQKVILENWPLSYFEPLRKKDGSFHSPIMARWRDRNAPQLYDPAVHDDVAHSVWSDVFYDYKLTNIAAHGVRDLSGTYTTYFTFSQIPEKLTERHSHLLDLLTPHMHVALSRALLTVEPFAGATADTVHLTERERVILYWVREGKTNWEIAQICNRSQHTIKNQIEALFRKLQVTSRAQAGNRAAMLQISLERPES
jgi:transcriptional regulator EpsA